MKLTLRDFLWLTLLVASLTMWALEWRRERRLASGHLSSILLQIGQGPSDQELKRRAALARFRSLSDAELDRRLGDVRCCGDWEQYSAEYEPCLIEMARRKMVAELAEHYRSLISESAGKSLSQHPHNLEIVTALRRAEGKPDPLSITLTVHDSISMSGNQNAVPVTAQLQNADVAQEPVLLWHEGRDWSQWTFTLTDQHGEQVSPLGSFGGMISSVFHYAPLRAGQTRCGDVFNLRRYIVPPKPGRYYLQAIYSNDPYIAPDEIKTRIVAKSEPIPVEVQNPDYGRSWAAASAPPPLAVFLACVVMVLTSIRRSTTKRAPLLSLGISRRDFRWGMLFVLLGLAMWATLPDTRDYDNTALDLAANWAIRRVHE